MDLIVEKKNKLSGEVVIPSDKSISHRAIMFSSLAKGKTLVKNFSKGADCHSTLKVFSSLGIEHKFLDEQTLEIISDGILKAPSSDLDCGNSGTTMRLMSGILASRNFDSVLMGDESLSKRPMKRVIEPLSLMGAEISSNDNKAPLKIHGKNLQAIDYNSKLSSAQVKSCILLAGINTKGVTRYTEPFLSRNHTELMLEYLGADIKVNGTTTSITKSELEAKNIEIAGDISSAAFFIVAGLITPNSDIIIKNVGLNPTRTGILEVVEKMGGDVEILDKRLLGKEEVGDLRIKTSALKATTIEGDVIPKLIDEIPVIAVLATQAEGTTVVKDAADLRNKESDRITTVVNQLRAIGADIEEREDGMIIHGKTTLQGGIEIDCHHDHRTAMSFYVAGLITKQPLLIKEFEWVNTSFPEFESLMNSVIKD